MMGFMGEEECAQMAERQAVYDIRRRRLRKMLRTRRANKGGLSGRADTEEAGCRISRKYVSITSNTICNTMLPSLMTIC